MADANLLSRQKLFLDLEWDSRAGPIMVIGYGNTKLGLALICHRKPERCLTFFGHKSLLCSRCTGISIGFFVFVGLMFLHTPIPMFAGIVLTLPMLADGFSQLLGIRQSNNALRLLTGFLFPIGFLSLLVK